MSITESKKAKIKAAIRNISDSLIEISDILLDSTSTTEPVAPQKRKKDPNAPKHPPSSYFLFMLDIKDQVEKEYPESTFSEKSKIYGAKWQKLSDKDKQVFVDKAKVEKEKYLKELAAYTKSQEGESTQPVTTKKAKKEVVAEPKKAKKQVVTPKKEVKTEVPVAIESSEVESSDSDSGSDSDSSNSDNDNDKDSSSSSSSSSDNETSSDSDSD